MHTIHTASEKPQPAIASRRPASGGEPRIAIIGGGITGLTSAFYLARAGYQVSLFESGDHAGGLAASFDFGPFHWDRFYHCILTSDSSLLRLLEDLDLTPELRWRTTEVGFYSKNRLFCMTRPMDLLRFPHLSLVSKLRFALGTIYAARFADGSRLEDEPLLPWVRRIFGRQLTEEIWDPLLRCKLGSMRERASAAFLWATLKRLYSTREKTAEKKERLGFVTGGYRRVLDRLLERTTSMGVQIHLGSAVSGVERVDGQDGVTVHANGTSERFDRVLLTVPNRIAARLCPAFPSDYCARLCDVQYLAMICVVLVLRRPLSPFYVTNITQQARFTGVIEMTNLIGTESTAGYSLVYLPKYTDSTDPLFAMDDAAVWTEFSRDLYSMHPKLRGTEIAARYVFRERFVQPVPTLGYSRILPPLETPVPGVFLANTSQIVNDTLNNNAMTAIARNACQRIIDSLAQQPTPAAREGASRGRSHFIGPEPGAQAATEAIA